VFFVTGCFRLPQVVAITSNADHSKESAKKKQHVPDSLMLLMHAMIVAQLKLTKFKIQEFLPEQILLFW
jgi:hypothetical protein